MRTHCEVSDLPSPVDRIPAEKNAVIAAATTRTASPATPTTPRRRRWTRRLLGVCVLAILFALFHAPLFRWLAGGLIVEDALEPVDAVVFFGKSGPFGLVAFDEAATLYRDGLATQVVLIEDRSDRVVRLGIVPPLESVARRELAARGVPPEAFTDLAITTTGEWEQARSLQTWLREHPKARVTVLAEQLASRRTAHAFGQVLAPEEAGRVRWKAVPDRRFGPTNWWHGRQGVATLTSEYVALGFVLLKGETTEPHPPWDPDEYEQALRRSR
jgi:uncharacterized SAM-binding protein YcdF (DUF218 family)